MIKHDAPIGDADGMDMPLPPQQDPSRHRSQLLTDEVQRLLRRKLIKDTCSIFEVADLYGVSRRTLSRHLKAEGRTFRQVRDEVLCELACTLLAETDLKLNQISEILNFSDPAAFTNAFRRWTGQAPSTWRSRHRR